MSQPQDDPFVPIVGDRVAAALRWRGLTVNALATAMEDNAQTLDSIVGGRTRRSRLSRRDRIATHLGCPSDWLGGEVELEGIVPWATGTQSGQPVVADEAGFLYRLTPAEGVGGGVPGGASAAYHLASWDLSRQIIAAWERDIRDDVPRALETKQLFESDEWPEWGRVRQAVKWLLNGLNWRRSFFQRPSLAEIGPLSPEALDQRRTDEEEFAIGQAKAVLIVLRPWLEGSGRINYADLADGLWHLLGAALSESRRRHIFGIESDATGDG